MSVSKNCNVSTNSVRYEVCPKCHGEGKIKRPLPEIHLLLCECGHGAHAWHDEIYGSCNYVNCPCMQFQLSYALVEDGKRLNYREFELWLKKSVK